DSRHDSLELRHESRMLRRLAEMRNAATEDGLRQFAAPRDPEAAIAAKRALTLLGHVHVVVGRIVDDAGHDLPLTLERDRDREQRDRVQEVGGGVERIDMPGVALVGPLDASALFENETIARPRLGEVFVESLLGAFVGETDEVAWPLHRHLQFADFAEI